jgi:arabinosaccharide transport system substrate-binding protein
MYYNTELLDAAGVDYTKILTWDDFEVALKKYHEKTGNYMTCCETYGAYQFTVLMAEMGKDLIEVNGMPELNSPEAIKAAERIRSWADKDLSGFIVSAQKYFIEGIKAGSVKG